MKKYSITFLCCTRCSLGEDQEIRFYTRWDLDELQGIAAETEKEARRIATERFKEVIAGREYSDLFGGPKGFNESTRSMVYEIFPGKRVELSFCVEYREDGDRPGCRNVVAYCGRSKETSRIVYQEFFKRLESKNILGYSSETKVIRKDKEGRLWNDIFLHLDDDPRKISIFPKQNP